MKTPGKRQQKFASMLRTIIAKNVQELVSQDLSNPNHLFSIGQVNISSDLRHAKIEVICHKDFMAENVNKLRQHTSVIRKKVAAFLQTKYVPYIQFVQASRYAMPFELKENTFL